MSTDEHDELPFPNPASTRNEAIQTSEQVAVGILPEDPHQLVENLLSQSSLSPEEMANKLEKAAADLNRVSGVFPQMPATVPGQIAAQMAPKEPDAVVPPHVLHGGEITRERMVAVIESFEGVRNASGLFTHICEIIDQIHTHAQGSMSYADCVKYFQDTVSLLTDPNSQRVLNLLARAPRITNEPPQAAQAQGYGQRH